MPVGISYVLYALVGMVTAFSPGLDHSLSPHITGMVITAAILTILAELAFTAYALFKRQRKNPNGPQRG
jgi:heme A synthase